MAKERDEKSVDDWVGPSEAMMAFELVENGAVLKDEAREVRTGH